MPRNPRDRKWSPVDMILGPEPKTPEEGRGRVAASLTKSDDRPRARFSVTLGFSYEEGTFIPAKFIPSGRIDEFQDLLDDAHDKIEKLQKSETQPQSK